MANKTRKTVCEKLVYEINLLKDAPEKTWRSTKNGLVGNIGNYHLDYQYDVIALVRVENESGGTRTIIGFETNRTLAKKLRRLVFDIKHKN